MSNAKKAKPMSWSASLWLVMQHVHINCMKNKKGSAIGVTTVFIVVFFIGLLQNILLRSPLIFLRLAETQAGEVDIVITPSTVSIDRLLDIGLRQESDPRFQFFNAREIEAKLANNSLILGTSPRWILRGSIIAKDGRSDARLATNILVCDLDREERLGVGRGWPYRPLGEGEAHVTASVLASLGLRGGRGDRVRVDIGLGKLLATFGLSPAALEQLLLASVLRDGLAVHLNGTLIAEQLAARGLPLPPGVLPDRIDTRIPVAQVAGVHTRASIIIKI